MKKALITGITGQDGSYLAELLLAKGYEVHGLVRRSSTVNIEPPPRRSTRTHRRRLRPPRHGRPLHLHYGDLNDGVGLISRLVRRSRPDEVYNLGAMSHVQVSFDMPEYTASTNGGGTVRLLEAIRAAGSTAASTRRRPRDVRPHPAAAERGRPFHPRSPYGASKVFAHWCTVNYREAYGLYAVSGILFNHESPRRGENFVTRKISTAVAADRARASRRSWCLGNLDAVRDWGYAPEYVEGMWLMLQQDEPDDFVLATGTGTTVREFTEAAFGHVGLDWEDHVSYDDRYERPAEAHSLIGDASKAHRAAGLEGPDPRPRPGADHGRRRPRRAPRNVIDLAARRPAPMTSAL